MKQANKQTACKRTSIGGQALLEGIMMRGPKKTVMATRMNDGTIDVEELPVKRAADRHKFLGWPLIRGVVNMVESMMLGYKALMRSAEKIGVDDAQEEPSRFEKWLDRVFGEKLMTVLTAIAAVLGVGLALFLFMWLPTTLFDLINNHLFPATDLANLKGLIEGVIKIIIFLLYIALVALMKDIHRTFEYHGAEHKTIFCYEAGLPLTVENVRIQRRFHPRCGTSFLILILLVSILLSSLLVLLFPALVHMKYVWIPLKILLIPVVCGVGYELIKLCGRHDNLFTKIISAPGLWVQRLTTKEPDDSMMEVAIASLIPVLPETEGEDNW